MKFLRCQMSVLRLRSGLMVSKVEPSDISPSTSLRTDGEQSRTIRIQISILFSVFCFLFSGCSQDPYYKSTQLLMGTYVEVISDNKDAAKIAFAEIRRLDNLLSKFKPESEISQLNKKGSLKVSLDTLAVIKSALEFYKKSGGSFDITVSPLVDIWKRAIHTKILPRKEAINSAKNLLGSDKIIINEKASTVKFLNKGMQIDLGGIAKGYAVDCAVKKLKSAGIKSCLVNAGGNMFAIGKKGNAPWKIGIQHPRKPNKIIGNLFLEDRAIATSGDYEQFFEIKGRRLSHIIDPKTGYPVDTGVVSVTIISNSATICDGLSTAVFVLGKEKGTELSLQFLDTNVLVFTKQDLKK